MMSVSVCWPDCKPEGPLFSAEFVCMSVCVCKGVLSGVNRYQKATNFLILSAGNCIVTVM